MISIKEAEKLRDRGALFFVSHSGGKDSQAMYIALSRIIPAEQMIVVHADLGAVEWEGVQDHIKRTVKHPVNVVAASKTFFDMVRRRAATRPDVPAWPSSATRQCTSDLKRDPIAKFIRQELKARGATLAVNCTGIRAEESSQRSKKNPLQLNKRLSTAGREVWDWMPIFDLTTKQVFAMIKVAGQRPFWAYQTNERLSCVFCIMGSGNDLTHGARQRPELFQEYLNLERETGWTMFNGQSLLDRVGSFDASPQLSFAF